MNLASIIQAWVSTQHYLRTWILWNMQKVIFGESIIYHHLSSFAWAFRVILKMLRQVSGFPCLRVIELQSVEGFPCADEAFWHWVCPWFMPLQIDTPKDFSTKVIHVAMLMLCLHILLTYFLIMSFMFNSRLWIIKRILQKHCMICMS